MITGFVVIALSSSAIALISTTAFWVWALVLFLTRVGAAAVESMNETYFFKKTGDTDADMLEFFRMTYPLSYVVAPLLGSLVLVFVDLRYLFVVLGIIMLTGIMYALKLRDTL